MMKWRYLVVLISTGLMACQGSVSKKATKNPMIHEDQIGNDVKSKNQQIEMEMKMFPDTLEYDNPTNTCKYVIFNNLEQEIVFPSTFTIEQWMDGKWEPLALNNKLVFEDILYSVAPKDSKEFPLAISQVLKDGTKKKGRYRFVKEAWVYQKDEERTKLTAEFVVK